MTYVYLNTYDTYIYTCLYIYIYVFIHIYIRVYIYIYTCLYTYIYLRIYFKILIALDIFPSKKDIRSLSFVCSLDTSFVLGFGFALIS